MKRKEGDWIAQKKERKRTWREAAGDGGIPGGDSGGSDGKRQ